MIDLSNIDIMALTSAETTVKRTASTEGGNYAGQCPKCGGSDRFIVLPEHTDLSGQRRGQFFCRGCHPSRGDAIEYLIWARSMSYRQALEFLHDQYSLDYPPNWQGGNGHQTSKKPAAQSYRVKPLPMSATAPSVLWQARARQVMTRGQHFLWDEKIGRGARDYLASRGLTPETVRAEGIGFIPADTYDDPVCWDLDPQEVEKVFLPSGIVFPYEYAGDIWKLRIRRIGADVPQDRRYMMVSGSSNGLYRADRITLGAVVALFEGEIDALSAAQASDFENEGIVCVATGSTMHARIPKWAMLLGRVCYCLLCFDADNAGMEARRYWLDRLDNATALALLAGRKDANDMLTAGDDLFAWLVDALNDAEVAARLTVIDPVIPDVIPDDTSIPEPEEEQEPYVAVSQYRPLGPEPDLPNHGLQIVCHTCGGRYGAVKWYGAYGNAYCARCWDGYQEAKARGVLLR